jgi:hypothetical protein
LDKTEKGLAKKKRIGKNKKIKKKKIQTGDG